MGKGAPRHSVFFLEGLAQDLIYTFRTIRRSPGFTPAVVLTLALGVGATVSGLRLRSSP